jgi:hypothetical protein
MVAEAEVGLSNDVPNSALFITENGTPGLIDGAGGVSAEASPHCSYKRISGIF